MCSLFCCIVCCFRSVVSFVVVCVLVLLFVHVLFVVSVVFAVCIEMFFAAIAHHYAFPPKEFNNAVLRDNQNAVFTRSVPGTSARVEPTVQLTSLSSQPNTNGEKSPKYSVDQPLKLRGVDSDAKLTVDTEMYREA